MEHMSKVRDPFFPQLDRLVTRPDVGDPPSRNHRRRGPVTKELDGLVPVDTKINEEDEQ